MELRHGEKAEGLQETRRTRHQERKKERKKGTKRECPVERTDGYIDGVVYTLFDLCSVSAMALVDDDGS